MKEICLPWMFTNVDENTDEEMKREFLGAKNGYIQVGADKYFFPKKFAIDGPTFYNFQPRSTDTWVVTFPRSGTTWTQELVWILKNNFNYKKAAKTPLAERFPFLEFSACFDEELAKEFKSGRDENTQKEIDDAMGEIMTKLDESREQRCIKSHLPLSLLNQQLLKCGAKVIYVARNPKDVAVSYYHLHRFFRTLDYIGDFEKFWNYFETNRLMWCPYWSHLKEAWDLRHNPNLLFLFYEELQKDTVGTIHRISNFLNVSLTTQDAIQLANHLDISNFRNNPSVNFGYMRELGIVHDRQQGFVRNGGTSKQSEFTPELERRADEWIERNLQGTTMRFPEKVIRI